MKIKRYIGKLKSYELESGIVIPEWELKQYILNNKKGQTEEIKKVSVKPKKRTRRKKT